MPSSYTPVTENAVPKKDLQKILTQRYMLAVGIIFFLSLLGFLSLRFAIFSQELSAKTINVSGKQRMLSQRIAMYAEEHVNAQDADTFVVSGRKLRASLEQFANTHVALTQGNKTLGIAAPESDALKRIYFEDSVQLDAQVEEYIRLNTYILTTSYKDRHRMRNSLKQVLAEADDRLLNSLDLAVKQYEQEAQQQIEYFKYIEIAVFATMVIALILEIFFIYRPAALQVGDAQKELERINILKTEFLANMSHEIRSPFAGIVTMIEFLKAEKLATKQYEMVAVMHQSSKHLLNILNNVLDISKIEYGVLTVEKEPLAIHDMAHQAADVFTATAQKKKIALHVEIEPSVPEYVLGDALRLSQVIGNLIGNAMKFTPEKGRVDVSLRHKNAKRLIIEVRDSGIGIAESQLKVIFDKYTQATDTTAREYGGSGLGLAISKQLVELMKGKISVKSDVGAGTCFKIILPLHAASDAQIAAIQQQKVAASNTAAYNKNARILLVDDNALNRQLIRAQLKKCHLQNLEFAESGKHAIDLVGKQPFDLILMDYNMPEMDGAIATQKIREIIQDRVGLKIVAMTASSLESDKDKCLQAGMDDFITKPIETEALRMKLHQWLAA